MFSTYIHPQSDVATFDSPDTAFQVVVDDSRKKFVCNYPNCGKFFRYKSEIVRHTATHSDSRPFNCPYDNCSKSFKRNDALENHIRSSHTRETPFVCPAPGCDAKFTTHGSFRYHVLKHNKQPGDEVSPIQSTESVHDPAQPRKQVKADPTDEGLTSPSEDAFDFDLTSMKKGQKEISDEFFVPPPRFASKIKWEMMNDDEGEASSPTVHTNDSGSYKEERDHLAQENQNLKQKLGTSEKIIRSMQKQIDDLINTLYSRQGQTNNVLTNSDYQGLPFQSIGLETRSKSEDALLDMINYGDTRKEFKTISPPRLTSSDSAVFDNLFSFDQDFNNFNF